MASQHMVTVITCLSVTQPVRTCRVGLPSPLQSRLTDNISNLPAQRPRFYISRHVSSASSPSAISISYRNSIGYIGLRAYRQHAAVFDVHTRDDEIAATHEECTAPSALTHGVE